MKWPFVSRSDYEKDIAEVSAEVVELRDLLDHQMELTKSFRDRALRLEGFKAFAEAFGAQALTTYEGEHTRQFLFTVPKG